MVAGRLSGTLPVRLETGADAAVREATRRFAYRAGDGDAAEKFLLGANTAQPFIVIDIQRRGEGCSIRGVMAFQIVQGLVGGHGLSYVWRRTACWRRDAARRDLVSILFVAIVTVEVRPGGTTHSCPR